MGSSAAVMNIVRNWTRLSENWIFLFQNGYLSCKICTSDKLSSKRPLSFFDLKKRGFQYKELKLQGILTLECYIAPGCDTCNTSCESIYRCEVHSVSDALIFQYFVNYVTCIISLDNWVHIRGRHIDRIKTGRSISFINRINRVSRLL